MQLSPFLSWIVRIKPLFYKLLFPFAEFLILNYIRQFQERVKLHDLTKLRVFLDMYPLKFGNLPLGLFVSILLFLDKVPNTSTNNKDGYSRSQPIEEKSLWVIHWIK